MAGIDPSLVLALQHGMAGDQLAILEDPNLGRVVLDLDDPPPRGVGNAVLIATHRHHAFLADAAFDRQHSVVGTARQGQKMGLFLGKILIHDPICGGMHPKSYDRRRTLAMRPLDGEMIKPAELIDIQGATDLSLAARRLYNRLLANVFGPDKGFEGRDFCIPLSELRGTHAGNERISDSIEALIKTVVIVRGIDGRTTRVQLLGGNDMVDSERRHGMLTYSFDKRLAPLLRESVVFAKLELAALQAFGTKYGLALYEALSRRVRLHYVFYEDFEIEAFRNLLGVPQGKLSSFGNLRQKAIEPAVQEVVKLAPFSCIVEPCERIGRKVIKVRLRWWVKSVDEMKAQWNARQEHQADLFPLPYPKRSSRTQSPSHTTKTYSFFSACD